MSEPPIPMLLPCPECGERHVDRGEFATKPHHTHACQHCGHVWRPAVVATVGVRFLPGFKDEAKPDDPRSNRIPTSGAMALARVLWSDLQATPMSEEMMVRAIAVTLDGVRDGAISSVLHDRRIERMRRAFAGWTIDDIEQELAEWKPHT